MVQVNHAYVDLIRKKYGLSPTDDIKKKENIQKIVNQISIKDIKNAIKNAQEIMNSKIDSDKIVLNSRFYYYNNPCMNIRKFFEELFREIGI